GRSRCRSWAERRTGGPPVHDCRPELGQPSNDSSPAGWDDLGMSNPPITSNPRFLLFPQVDRAEASGERPVVRRYSLALLQPRRVRSGACMSCHRQAPEPLELGQRPGLGKPPLLGRTAVVLLADPLDGLGPA